MTRHPTVNVASHLPIVAEADPDALAVVIQHGQSTYTEHTFRELNEESDRIAHGLKRLAIADGVRTVLMVKPSFEFFALTFALLKVGAIPVMVDPGMGVPNLKKCLAEAEPQAFIGIPKAHVARLLFGWGKPTLKTLVTVGPRLFWGGSGLAALRNDSSDPYPMAEPQPDDMAAILFTSGSTGVPKGAVYTHAMFSAQVESLRRDYNIEPGERDLATFPLFALFGPALGMAAIVPDMDASKPAQADPKKIIAAIKKYEATNMFGSPALLDVVGRCQVPLPTLRRVISAGAPADPESLETFSTMLWDTVEIFPSYGATESLPVSYIGSRELIEDTKAATEKGAGICVGRPIKGMEIAIINITDDPVESWTDDLLLPQGEIGEIVVKGPVVSPAYYNRPESTALAKIYGPAPGEIRHRMGDVGYFDDQGRLWMCGRKSHRVEMKDETLFTIPCERVFNTHPSVRRTALVGIQKNGQTLPVICAELGTKVFLKLPDFTLIETKKRSIHIINGEIRIRFSRTDKDTIKKELLAIAQENPKTKAIATFLFHPRFPVDIRHNAKIFREKLALWAEDQLS